jgi:predicted Zn-dependent protease with MMP-like domain
MPQDPLDKALDKAWESFADGRLARAEKAAREAISLAPDHGAAWWALGAVLERAGRLLAADRAFHRAARASREPQAMPCRVSASRFVASVDKAKAALPPQLAEALGEVTLVLADRPTLHQLADAEAEDLLGWFSGPTRSERADSNYPPSIHLFRVPHQHQVSTIGDFDDEVRRTLFHEFGHYLGFDESDMERFGLD